MAVDREALIAELTEQETPPQPPADRDLKGVVLARESLPNVNLSRCDLTGADLSEADLSGADLSWAILVDANLAGAQLEGTELLGANLTGADLTDVVGTRSVFGGANLTRAILFGAKLTDSSLSQANLTDADCRAADLTGSRLRESNLTATNLQRATLREVDLEGSTLTGATFDSCDLRGAHLKGILEYQTASWIAADIRDVDFTGSYLVRRHVMDENYLYEFRNQNRFTSILYKVWWLTSDCGRSLLRWAAWTVLVAVMFAGLYMVVDVDFGAHPKTFLSALYFSIVTLTTLGYGDVLPASSGAQLTVLAEVIMGYLALGGLLSIFANKMGRRAD